MRIQTSPTSDTKSYEPGKLVNDAIVIPRMGLITKLLSFKRMPPPAPANAAMTPTSPAPSQPAQPKTLAELEQQMAAEAKQAQVLPTQRIGRPQSRNIRGKLVGLTLLIGIPVGFIAFVNLPYPLIRRPIARTAPILLMPSYISFDNHYRSAINHVEQAKQLIDQATASADLELGRQKLQQAKADLDQLPIWIASEWSDVAGAFKWYGRRYSIAGFTGARSDVGRLEAKLFQEENAQTALMQVEQALTLAKQQYQLAKTPTAHLAAINQWRGAIDQFSQIPPETLTGRMAQPKLNAALRDFEATAGVIAGDQQSIIQIQAAKGFALTAAQASQNPPHSVEQWQRVEGLWETALQRLRTVSQNDPTGYTVAQGLMATYQDNLEQIKIRRQREFRSVEAFREAEFLTQNLVANAPNTRANYHASYLQQIISKLKQVEPGTTVYKKAQPYLQDAQNRLSKIKLD